MPGTIISTFPTVAAIVPTARATPFSDPAWIFEPKYDGFRGLVYISWGECVMRSKRGNVFTRFRELGPAICAQLRAKEVILDGEILALDDEGRPIFHNLLRSGVGRLAYAVF